MTLLVANPKTWGCQQHLHVRTVYISYILIGSLFRHISTASPPPRPPEAALPGCKGCQKQNPEHGHLRIMIISLDLKIRRV